MAQQGWMASRGRRIAASGAVIIAIAGAMAWWYYSDQVTTDNAQIDGHIAPIASRVAGPVIEVKVTDNQPVEAGALLIRVDPRDYQVAVARAEADLADAKAALQAATTGVPIAETTTAGQLATARANVARAAAGVEISRKDVDGAGAHLAAARARLREAQASESRTGRDLERMKQLIAKDEISQQQYDAAVAAADAARAAVDSVKAAVVESEQSVMATESRHLQAEEAARQAQADLRTASTAPAQMTVIRARAGSAEARVAQASASLEQARNNLAYTSLTSPIAGIVSRKSVEPGQVVAPGQPLMAIVPLASIWVTANFKETQLQHMRPGQRARVRVDAYGRDYLGRVDSIAAATGARFSVLPPENATGNYVKVVQRIPVKIVLDASPDRDQLLRPGMSVTATVITR